MKYSYNLRFYCSFINKSITVKLIKNSCLYEYKYIYNDYYFHFSFKTIIDYYFVDF